MIRPSFPEVVDSSMLASFRACPRRFAYEYLEHWKPKTESVHLVAGKAFAAGLEALRLAFFGEGRSVDAALEAGSTALIREYGDFECPADSAKSLERMLGALEYYTEAFPLTDEPAPPTRLAGDKLGVEFSFAEPIEEVCHPVTGAPLIYCGRMDQIVDFAGAPYGEDDKTTSQLGASWSRQWDLRSQFTSYCWGARRAGIPLQGFLVRGIAILKTKWDHSQAITYRPEWQIQRWYAQTCKDLLRMIEQWESGAWDYNLDHSCNEYGGCAFRKICLSDRPQLWLETDFERRRWDPVTRMEVKLEQEN